MEKKNITPEELISKGYNEYNLPSYYEFSKSRFFQKKISDNKGIKYFINFTRHEYDNDKISIKVMWEVNFQFKPKGYDTIQIELVQWFNEGDGFCNEGNHTIEEVEELCEKIFNKMEGEYYD